MNRKMREKEREQGIWLVNQYKGKCRMGKERNSFIHGIIIQLVRKEEKRHWDKTLNRKRKQLKE